MQYLEVIMNWELKQQIHKVCGSQVEFAHLVKCNETLVSKVVQGRRKLKPEMQLIWAKVLGCKLKDIFANESPNSK